MIPLFLFNLQNHYWKKITTDNVLTGIYVEITDVQPHTHTHIPLGSRKKVISSVEGQLCFMDFVIKRVIYLSSHVHVKLIVIFRYCMFDYVSTLIK